jgi:uncharacterized protein YukE
MAQLGMDTAQAASTAKTFSAEAGTIAASINKVDGALKSTWWKGSDREKFVGSWEGSKKQLLAAKALLEQAGRDLDRQRTEQEATSSR